MHCAPLLTALSSVRHGFFTRANGVSQGLYRGCNCGPGSADDPEAVAENRARVATALGLTADRLLTLYQVHSAKVVTVTASLTAPLPQADALVTTMPALALGILTADCVPVLFATTDGSVIGAAHAGWKGAIGGILDNTLAAMEELGAKRQDIHAAIGPCIAQESYEVGPEFLNPFLQQREENHQFFQPSLKRAGHWQFDLGGYVAHRLAQSGVTAVERIAEDTCTNEAEFFSYRRATLRGETDYGRHISVIVRQPQ